MDLFNLREPVSAWSHGLWLLMALPGAALLWRRAAGNRARQFVLVGYIACLAFCAGASAIYHSVRAPADVIAQYLLFDHIGIYALIAGTYTPIAWTLMRGRWRVGTLTVVWLTAALGTWLHLAVDNLPNWLITGIYMAMGWGSVICYLELNRITSHRTLSPVVTGGALYSVGALIHVLDWPPLWPGVVGAHEVFHVLVVAASITHYRFILRVIAPWNHPLPAEALTVQEPRSPREKEWARPPLPWSQPTGAVFSSPPRRDEVTSRGRSLQWPIEG